MYENQNKRLDRLLSQHRNPKRKIGVFRGYNEMASEETHALAISKFKREQDLSDDDILILVGYGGIQTPKWSTPRGEMLKVFRG